MRLKNTMQIVIADDDADDRMLIDDAFKEARLANPIDFVVDGEELLEYLRGTGKFAHRVEKPHPGLILLDLNMPGVRGFSGLLLLRAQYPDVPVAIISAVEDGAVMRRAFELGASGYLHKSVGPAEIRRAIETVLSGEVFVPEGIDIASDDDQTALMRRLGTLTPQQVRVLMMLSDGLMNKQIAYELSISEATVKAHVSAILQKLDVDSRTQAVIAAARIEEGQFEALLSTGREPV